MTEKTHGSFADTPSEYTPGPWKPCRSHEEFSRTYFDIDEGEKEFYDAKPFTSIQAKEGAVASAHDLFEFKKADAYLIAAAPDMLEALKRLASFAEEAGFSCDFANAAIAKAHGK